MLKDIRDSLAGPPRPNNNRDDNNDNDDNDNDNDDNDDNNNDDNDDDDYDDDDDDNLNKKIYNIQNSSEHYVRLIAYQNIIIEKLKEELTDKKNLTQDII